MSLIDKIKEWGSLQDDMATTYVNNLLSEIEAEVKALESRTLESLIQSELMARCEKIREKTEEYVSAIIEVNSFYSGNNDIEYIYYDGKTSIRFKTLATLTAHMDKLIKE